MFWDTISWCSQELREGLILCKAMEKYFLGEMTFKMVLEFDWKFIKEKGKDYSSQKEPQKYVQRWKNLFIWTVLSCDYLQTINRIFRFVCYVGNVLTFWSHFTHLYISCSDGMLNQCAINTPILYLTALPTWL